VPVHCERLRALANAHAARLMIVELHAAPAIITQRLRQRTLDEARHPGHLDSDLADEIQVETARQHALSGLRACADVWLRRDTSGLDDATLQAIASAILASLPTWQSVGARR